MSECAWIAGTDRYGSNHTWMAGTDATLVFK